MEGLAVYFTCLRMTMCMDRYNRLRQFDDESLNGWLLGHKKEMNATHKNAKKRAMPRQTQGNQEYCPIGMS